MQTIGPIEAGEIKTVRFDFSTEVLADAVLSAASVQVALLTGTHASPGAILVGGATVLTHEVVQKVQAGPLGCTYKLSAFVSDAAGNRHKVSCKLTVSPN